MTIGADMSFDPTMSRLRKKANKQLRQTTAEQLEQETKKMEERIRALKNQMVKEKEEREKFGGTRWMSGKSGPVLSHQASKKKPNKAEKGPRKFKILTDEPLSSYSKKSALRESLNESFGNEIVCGQCEKTKATLACVECSENYCVGCFMGFHRKGALRNHTTQNLDKIASCNEDNSRIANRSDQKPPTSRRFQSGNSLELKTGGSLLNGVYDEKESSDSFAQALKEWRNTKDKENTWVNPANKVSSISCETSTTQEKVQPVEINLNFGSNKSMSYLDRLVLKKHRDSEPCSNLPPRKTEKSTTNYDEKPFVGDTADDFGINYREIFQTIGVHSARSKSTPCQDFLGRSSVVIEEVQGPLSDAEETTACIVEESTINTTPIPPIIPSRAGCVSILGMTPLGDFEDITKAGQTSNSQSRKSPLDRIKLLSPSASSRVWSPKPTYTGLSDFFLAGVKSSPTSNIAKVHDKNNSSSIVSKQLSKGVWKPNDSVSIVETTEEPQNECPFPVIPLVQEPTDIEPPQLQDDKKPTYNLYDSQPNNNINMQDFGINDFLKAGPVPRKLSVDYNDVHRVSTVSPLTLSPRPPQLNWSDDDSDDDVIGMRGAEVPHGFHSKAEQDEEDRVTLEDLTWELASTTGRLTHCEGELDDSLDASNDGNDVDDDSIEEDNGGISLDEDSSDDLEADELSNSKMKDEVHLLK